MTKYPTARFKNTRQEEVRWEDFSSPVYSFTHCTNWPFQIFIYSSFGGKNSMGLSVPVLLYLKHPCSCLQPWDVKAHLSLADGSSRERNEKQIQVGLSSLHTWLGKLMEKLCARGNSGLDSISNWMHDSKLSFRFTRTNSKIKSTQT